VTEEQRRQRDDEYLILGQVIKGGGTSFPQDKLSAEGLTDEVEVVLQRLHNKGLIGRSFSEFVGGPGPTQSLIHVKDKGREVFKRANEKLVDPEPPTDQPPAPSS